MADISVFCLFCEDVRAEEMGKSSYIGVSGGLCLLNPEQDSTERLKVVCLARMYGSERRAVQVSINASVRLDEERVAAPPSYTAEFERNSDDDSEEWQLQIVVDLKEMPACDGAVAEVVFKVEDVSSTAHIMFTCDQSLMISNQGRTPKVRSRSGALKKEKKSGAGKKALK